MLDASIALPKPDYYTLASGPLGLPVWACRAELWRCSTYFLCRAVMWNGAVYIEISFSKNRALDRKAYRSLLQYQQKQGELRVISVTLSASCPLPVLKDYVTAKTVSGIKHCERRHSLGKTLHPHNFTTAPPPTLKMLEATDTGVSFSWAVKMETDTSEFALSLCSLKRKRI